jgi:hypothetical protein
MLIKQHKTQLNNSKETHLNNNAMGRLKAKGCREFELVAGWLMSEILATQEAEIWRTV